MQVEQATRIRRAYIEALEDGRYETLPGDVYVKGFLRNYAQFLGLDPAELIEVYRSSAKTAILGAPRMLDEPLFQGRAPRRIVNVLVFVLVIAILAIAVWYAYNRYYLGINDPWPLSSLPTQATPAAPTWVASLPIPTRPAATATHQAIPTTTTLAPTVTLTAEPTRSPTLTPRPTSTLTRTPANSPTPTQVLNIQVDAQILAECYARVVIDGEQVLERILQRGENQSWIAQERVILRLGNAAAAQLTVNGVSVPPLGAAGEIVDLEYTLDNLPTP